MALTGREIIDKSEKLKSPDSTYSEVEMTIQNAGAMIEKSFNSFSMVDFVIGHSY